MNAIIYALILLFVSVSGIEELKQRRGDINSANGPHWIPGLGGPGNPEEVGIGNQMNSTVFMSVNHYYCAAEDVEDQVLILYGTKSWTFPMQDVDLTLSYPTVNMHPEFMSEDEGYIITAFKVVLYIDGMETKGYIMEGGVLQETLVLSFVSRSITSLSYEFWLHGTPKHGNSGLYNELNTRYFICT